MTYASTSSGTKLERTLGVLLHTNVAEVNVSAECVSKYIAIFINQKSGCATAFRTKMEDETVHLSKQDAF